VPLTPRSLSIDHLTVTTEHNGQRRALVEDLSLTVRRGRVLALVGASGSGKSMTCAAALDTLPPGVRISTGRVLVDDTPQPPEALRGRMVATIMQNPRSAFNPVRTMRDHALETLKAVGRAGPNAHQTILAALTEVGLEDPKHVLGLYPFEMSGGMLQRMMIAIAVLSEAPFLFADEPTTDLDLVVQMRILDLLEQLARDRGLGMLLVTHDIGVVARLADDVAIIDQGRVVEQAAVETLFTAPQHPMTRMLVREHLSLYGLELTP
jgi:nickel transport system ATP-binding protein